MLADMLKGLTLKFQPDLVNHRRDGEITIKREETVQLKEIMQ